MSLSTLIGDVFRARLDVANDLQAMVRGACCSACLRPMHDGPVFFNADTTRRTVHWDCRSVEDDPGKVS